MKRFTSIGLLALLILQLGLTQPAQAGWWDDVKSGAGSLWGTVSDGAAKARDVVVEKASRTRDAVVDTAVKTRDVVVDTAVKTRDVVVDKAVKTRDAVTGTARRVGEAVAEKAIELRKWAGNTYEDIRNPPPFKVYYVDGSGKKYRIREAGDVPEGSVMNPLAREMLANKDFAGKMKQRQNWAGLGSTKVYLDETSEKGAYYSQKDEHISISPKSLESKGFDLEKYRNGDEEQQRILKTQMRTISHEYGHAIMDDMYSKSLSQNYGPDGDHYSNEITDRQTALKEGWAEGLEPIPGDGLKDYYHADRLRRETDASTENEPDYEWMGVEQADMDDLLRCEGVVADVIRRSIQANPDNERVLFEAMKQGDDPRDLIRLLQKAVELHPERAGEFAVAFDEATRGKADRDLITVTFGETAVEQVAEQRLQRKPMTPEDAGQPGTLLNDLERRLRN